MKQEYRDISMKIGRPVITKIRNTTPDHYTSDCPMAGRQIESGLPEPRTAPEHPLKLLRIAYGI